MRTLGRLLVAYLCAGLIVAALENWVAHTRSGSSIIEVVGSAVPPSEKTAAFYDLVLFPILVWPVRVMEMIRAG